jgi:hypothetical protein
MGMQNSEFRIQNSEFRIQNPSPPTPPFEGNIVVKKLNL